MVREVLPADVSRTDSARIPPNRADRSRSAPRASCTTTTSRARGAGGVVRCSASSSDTPVDITTDEAQAPPGGRGRLRRGRTRRGSHKVHVTARTAPPPPRRRRIPPRPQRRTRRRSSFGENINERVSELCGEVENFNYFLSSDGICFSKKRCAPSTFHIQIFQSL